MLFAECCRRGVKYTRHEIEPLILAKCPRAALSPLFWKTSPVFSKVDNQRFWLEAETCRCSVTSLAVSPKVVRLKTASHRIAATRLQRESSGRERDMREEAREEHFADLPSPPLPPSSGLLTNTVPQPKVQCGFRRHCPRFR